MRIISELTEALRVADYIEGLDIPNERKAAILEEVRNVMPEGVSALQFKLTAEIVREQLRKRIDALLPPRKEAARSKTEAA